MNIWEIVYDYDYPGLMIPHKYTNLASPGDDQSDTVMYDFEGIPLKAKWVPLDLCVDNDSRYVKGRSNFLKDEEFGSDSHTIKAFGSKLLEDVELLPIFIDSKEFYLIHIIRFVDCLDTERSVIIYSDDAEIIESNLDKDKILSDYDYTLDYVSEDSGEIPLPVFITLDDKAEDNDPFNISHIKKFVIRGERVPDCMLFRVPEKFVYLFATDKFRDIYIANGFTGLTFTPVEIS